jgi:hypothetical protein
MVRSCMAQAKINSLTDSDADNKEAIQQASDLATIVTTFFNEAFKLNAHLQTFIKEATEDDELQLLYGLCYIFCPNGYYAIGKKNVFKNNDLKPTYPDAICIWQNCLQNLDFPEDINDSITTGFMEIYNMWQKGEGMLPLYNININNHNSLVKSKFYKLDPQVAVNFIATKMLI